MVTIGIAKSREHAPVADGKISALRVKREAKSCAVVNIRRAVVSVVPRLDRKSVLAEDKAVRHVKLIVDLIVRIVRILPEIAKLSVEVEAVIRVRRYRQSHSAVILGVIELTNKFRVLVRGSIRIFPYPFCLFDLVHTLFLSYVWLEINSALLFLNT